MIICAMQSKREEWDTLKNNALVTYIFHISSNNAYKIQTDGKVINPFVYLHASWPVLSFVVYCTNILWKPFKILLISYVNCPVVTCNNISTVGRSLTRVSNSGGDDLKNHILDYLFPKVPYIRCIFVSDTRFYQVWQDTYNKTSDKSVSCMNLVLFHELQSNSTFEAEWFCIWYRRLFPI